MRHLLAILALALTFACSGGGSSQAPAPAPAPGPSPAPAPAPIARGTYQARRTATAAEPGLAPIGSMIQTLIVQNDGNGRLELDGWEHVRAVIYADPQGDLKISPDATLTHANGTTVPLTLTGQRIGDRLVGTCNGGAFDLTLTTIQDVPQNLDTKLGTYISTASSNGQVMKMTLTAPSGPGIPYQMKGEAYPSRADLDAGTNLICKYQGSFSYSDGDNTHVRNCFNAGFQMILVNPDGTLNYLAGGTAGLAYFTDTGDLVMLTANHSNSNLGSGQLSGYFIKQ